MPTSSPSSRLLRLLSTLQTGREWPGTALADRLGVSPRTIRRDIDRLRTMGYRISATVGPDGGYLLEAGSALPPLMFDDDQAVAVAVALQKAMVPGSGTEEASLRAFMTLRQVMPHQLKHRLDRMPITVLSPSSDEGSSASVSPALLSELGAVVRDQQVLRFSYVRGGATESVRRRIEPHGLVASGHRWYLLGWDLDREDWRLFRADRIQTHPPHGPRFLAREVPGGSVSTYVSARFKGSDDQDRWPCVGTVILDLPPERVSPFVGDGQVEPEPDGRSRVQAGAWSWVALAAAFSRFDASMEVVEPAELREAFAVLAERCAATSAPSARDESASSEI